MQDNSRFDQHDFRSAELDPRILSCRFEVRTNWHVIAGAQSCGKTTLIEQLAARGLLTAPEGARMHLEAEMAKGRKAAEIRSNLAAFQRGIVETQLRIEGALGATDVVFLDTAVPCCLAWRRLCGLDPNAILAHCFRNRYASVFILERLPVELDGLRPKDDSQATFVDEWIRRDFRALRYRVVDVPVLPPEERVEFVLGTLSMA